MRRVAITRRHWFALTSVFLTLGIVACGNDSGSSTSDSKPPSPGVSFLDYSPKPFFKDMDEMTVTFTTTGRAGGSLAAEREYRVVVFTGRNNRDKDCYKEFGAEEGVLGGPGETT